MSVLFVPYVAAAVVLLAAGVPKVADPSATQRAAASAGLPSAASLVRALGVAEVGAGLAALLVGGRLPAAAVAAAFAGFAVVVARGLVRGDLDSCGCFSGDDSPPSVLHVVVDAVLASCAAAVALASPAPRSLAALVADDLGSGALVAALGLTVAGLVYLLMAGLPRIRVRRTRRERRRATGAGADGTHPAATVEGDAVDIRGTDPEGAPLVVPLEATPGPTLLAFLSTSCGLCVGYWERLRDGALAAEVPGVSPVVVTKDAAVEDPELIRQLTDGRMRVVLSSEAWHDYEVPASPYAVVVSAAPGSVVTEGAVRRWDDIVAMAASVTEDQPIR